TRRQQAVSGVCGLGALRCAIVAGGFSLFLEAAKKRLETCRQLLRNVIDRGPAFGDGMPIWLLAKKKIPRCGRGAVVIFSVMCREKQKAQVPQVRRCYVPKNGVRC